MKVNWLVRVKNKNFWITFIPAILVLVATVMRAFGIEIDIAGISDSLLEIIEALFVVLTLIGVVNDPTTEGLSDSTQAMYYEEPKES